EQNNIYKNTTNFSFNSPDVVPIFVAPGDSTMPANNMTSGNRGATSYSANWQVFGSTDGGQARIPSSFQQGTSTTVCFSERMCICQSVQHIWGEDSQGGGPGSNNYAPEFHPPVVGGIMPLPQFNPPPALCNPNLVQSFSTGVLMAGMGDGSVKSVSRGISQDTWGVVCN